MSAMLLDQSQLSQLIGAEVIRINESGGVLVSTLGELPSEVVCQVLQSTEAPAVRLHPGDSVLVCLLEPGGSRGVVLGRIGGSDTQIAERRDQRQAIPEELIIEATKGLTLRCGDGSITLRADGKILIKGKDLVSWAQRMNRVKGGAVAIN